MIRWLSAIVLLALAVPAAAQGDEPRAAIEAAMTQSARGWNAGDLDAFLGVYSDDPSTSFTGSTGVVRGKAAIRKKYVADYAAVFGPSANRAAIPPLSFEYVDFRPIGADHVQVIARWRLGSGEWAQSGMTTVLFRREAAGWHIVADHSS
ncbi:YybH family protein [Sphingomonas japonica]|uniref:Ketosteroid isomerase-like protein n=1 Tax=Sphingomonas japonica TaxID=511662 RepID=A0ABX0U1X7_9SPHN|nr:nuclear transport factor 2 family protein [Sphingomonas japonica]NIJ24571.1 ketosteroid isomerase-like protein [Sphingomonas japonica]